MTVSYCLLSVKLNLKSKKIILQIELPKKKQAKAGYFSIAYGVLVSTSQNTLVSFHLSRSRKYKYFLHFEKVLKKLHLGERELDYVTARCGRWKSYWVIFSLLEELFTDYDTLKDRIVKGYQFAPEAYHQKFWNLDKNRNRAYLPICSAKEPFIWSIVSLRKN